MPLLNEPRLKKLLQRHAHHDPPPVAVFDCDGTVIRGDIGEALFYYQIEQMLFQTPPAAAWEGYAVAATLAPLFPIVQGLSREERLRDPAFKDFAEELLRWYFDQMDDHDIPRVARGCGDIVSLFADFTPVEALMTAEASFLNEVQSPVGTRTLGKRTLPIGIRFLRESRQLVRQLQEAGFEIWAVSGSSVWSVIPVFRRLGVAADHVVGIDLEQDGDSYSSVVRTPIPVHAGKVHALKQVCARQPVLVASDSPLDIPLLDYAAELRVFVNTRYKDADQFFDIAGAVRDDSWLILDNPVSEEWQMQR